MENIQEFIAVISKKGGIAKKNRFRIEITLSGVLSSLSPDNGRDMSLLCESISFPSKAITSFDFSSYRNPIKIPTGFTNEDVSIVFHLTNDYYIKNIFDKWFNSIVDTEEYLLSYDNQFKTNVKIFQLDEKDNDIYGVELREAYPISMSAIELDNTSNSATQKMTVDLTYNTWFPVEIKR